MQNNDNIVHNINTINITMQDNINIVHNINTINITMCMITLILFITLIILISQGAE